MAAMIAPLLTQDRPFDQFDNDLDSRFAELDRLEALQELEPASPNQPTTPEAKKPATPEFEVVLVDGSTEAILGASAYTQEGQMTTFFRTGEGDPIIDAWSERLISIRTTDIKLIRRSQN